MLAAVNCWRISPEADGESVCLPFPPSCLDTRRKTHHRCEYNRIRLRVSFVHLSYFLRTFSSCPVSASGPVDREKFLSYFTKKGDLFWKGIINQSYFIGSRCEAFPVPVCTSKGLFFLPIHAGCWNLKCLSLWERQGERGIHYLLRFRLWTQYRWKVSPSPQKKRSRSNIYHKYIWKSKLLFFLAI